MKKRKRVGRLKTWSVRPSSQQEVIEMKGEDLARYIRRAEKDVLPMIKERQLGPAAAQFLLAQETHTLVTGDRHVSPESAMAIANSVIAVWEAGYYTPGPAYPYTLEETLREVRGGSQTKKDYAHSFRPFTAVNGDPPCGLGRVYGGIAKHPETNLWQIWMMMDGPCTFIAAYHDLLKAQNALETIINASRRGGSMIESAILYKRLQSQADGKPKQLPFEMMQYLVEHLDRYVIKL